MSESNYLFISVANKKSKKIEWYPLLEDGTVLLSAKVDNYEEYLRVAVSYSLQSRDHLKRYMDIRKAEYRDNPNECPKNNVLYAEFVGTHLIPVLGGERYLLNCKSNVASAKVVKDIRTGQYAIERSNDITYKFNRRSVESKLLTEFYGQIENGDYLLYYLNEFRNIRQIPVLILSGYGGSGKSTIINHFSSYKQHTCKSYFEEKYTGDFGNTSLIVQEEAEKESNCPKLSLNALKELSTNNIHRLRLMHSDPTTANGFVTILLSCNDNHKSLIMQMLNSKGEDVYSIKRRMSTFYFTEANKNWIKQNAPGTDIDRGHLVNEADDLQPDCTTDLDAHLNWLEDQGFFNSKKFTEKTTPLFVLVHSPRINICDRLSDNDALLLEELFNEFVTKLKGDTYKLSFVKETPTFNGNSRVTPEYRPIERAFFQIGNKIPGETKVRKQIEYVCPETFQVWRSNNAIRIGLLNPRALRDIYRKHNPEQENLIPQPNRINREAMEPTPLVQTIVANTFPVESTENN